MRVTYDHEVDALYISISESSRDKQKIINDDITLDLSNDGMVVGIEILDAIKNYGRNLLEFNLSLLGGELTKRIPQENYTAEEVAELLQVNKETVLRMIRTGRLAALRLGKGYKIPRVELDKLLTP